MSANEGGVVVFDPDEPAHHTSVALPSLGIPTGVSCPSSTQCTLVDGGGGEITFDPASPGQPSATFVDPNQGGLASVSCPSGTECVAGDFQGEEVTFNPVNPGGSIAPNPVLSADTLPVASNKLLYDSDGTAQSGVAEFLATVQPGPASTTTWQFRYGIVGSSTVWTVPAAPQPLGGDGVQTVSATTPVPQIGQLPTIEPYQPYRYQVVARNGSSVVYGNAQLFDPGGVANPVVPGMWTVGDQTFHAAGDQTFDFTPAATYTFFLKCTTPCVPLASDGSPTVGRIGLMGGTLRLGGYNQPFTVSIGVPSQQQSLTYTPEAPYAFGAELQGGYFLGCNPSCSPGTAWTSRSMASSRSARSFCRSTLVRRLLCSAVV